ncbi:MAG: ABC transporter permease subunit, partial [Bacillota bacterium]
MNTRAMRAIMRKDLVVVLRSPAVMIPLIIVPAVMLLALPLLVGLIPRLDPSSVGGLDRLIAGLPPSIAEQVAGMVEVQTAVYLALVYLFAPLYLVVPLMVASVIAADSFAGEKERGTLEALLYAPLTDRELFAAKMLTAQVPAVIVAWGGALLYGVVANWVGWQILGHRLFPNLMWTILALWVAPAGA